MTRMTLQAENGTVVLVAKVPLKGRCKTRLIPLLGEEGSCRLALSMLKDVVVCLNQISCNKVILYAPGDDQGRLAMTNILEDLQSVSVSSSSSSSFSSWTLIPLHSSSLTDSNLSIPLALAVRDVLHHFPSTHSLVFVGMDAPEIPRDQVVAALSLPSRTALLCPTADGGYGLLGLSTLLVSSSSESSSSSLSSSISPSLSTDGVDQPLTGIFDGVLWSHSLTCVSQIKALQVAGFSTTILGSLMFDIDEPEDVLSLCQRLQRPNPYDPNQPQQQQHQQTTQTGSIANDEAVASDHYGTNGSLVHAVQKYGCLTLPSMPRCKVIVDSSLRQNCDSAPSRVALDCCSDCVHTRQALQDLGLLTAGRI